MAPEFEVEDYADSVRGKKVATTTTFEIPDEDGEHETPLGPVTLEFGTYESYMREGWLCQTRVFVRPQLTITAKWLAGRNGNPQRIVPLDKRGRGIIQVSGTRMVTVTLLRPPEIGQYTKPDKIR